jgi:hypothetical protein
MLLIKAVFGGLTTVARKSIIDVFTQIGLIAKSKLHHSVHLRWVSEWREFDSAGNWFTKPDWLDYFEMFDRIREELGADLGVTTTSFERMPQTVGETVERVWGLRFANASSQSIAEIKSNTWPSFLGLSFAHAFCFVVWRFWVIKASRTARSLLL